MKLTEDKPHSPEWFAARIIPQLRYLKSKVGKRRIANVIDVAMAAQRLADMAFFKAAWEKHTYMGKRQHEG